MTLTAQNPAVFYDATVHDTDAYNRFAKARDGNSDAIATLMGAPHFVIDVACTASTDDGVVLSMGGASGQGVTFPAGSRREIRFRTTSRSGGSTAASTADHYVSEIVQVVHGVASATTANVSHPVVEAAVLVSGHRTTAGGTVGKYGRVEYVITGELDQATTAPTETLNEAGIALGANSFTNGAATLSFPSHYDVRLLGAHYLQASFDATAAYKMEVDVVNDTIITYGLNGTTAANELKTPLDGDVLSMAFEIWPPTYVRCVASATTAGTANTPALVTVELDSNLTASGTTYNAKHRVEVFVGPAKYDRE